MGGQNAINEQLEIGTQHVKKNRSYHVKQIEENNAKIQRYYDSIKVLEECNVKEQRIVDAYDEVLKKIEG